MYYYKVLVLLVRFKYYVFVVSGINTETDSKYGTVSTFKYSYVILILVCHTVLYYNIEYEYYPKAHMI